MATTAPTPLYRVELFGILVCLSSSLIVSFLLFIFWFQSPRGTNVLMIASKRGSCPINSIVQELVPSAMDVTNIDDDNDSTMSHHNEVSSLCDRDFSFHSSKEIVKWRGGVWIRGTCHVIFGPRKYSFLWNQYFVLSREINYPPWNTGSPLPQYQSARVKTKSVAKCYYWPKWIQRIIKKLTTEYSELHPVALHTSS